jgi:hypothetical protein
MQFLSYQDNRSPICPSCQICNKNCKHVTRCPEEGRTSAFVQSTQEVERWMTAQHTHSDLSHLLLRYLRGRGTITCLECTNDLNLPPVYREYAASQDIIGWDGYAMGMISNKLLPLQSAIRHNSKSSSNTTRWISGFITQLLQVTHTQWICHCVLVHNRATGTLISTHKEELLKEIKQQLLLGADGLDEQDWFLLECNFDELATTSGEHQEYWLLAIQAAREASRIRSGRDDTTHCGGHGRGWRRAYD